MSTLIELVAPKRKELVYDLLRAAGIDVSDWKNYKGGAHKAAANPKYCYNWSFEKPEEFIVLCIWRSEIVLQESTLALSGNLRSTLGKRNAQGAAVWRRRAGMADRHVMNAYLERLPVRAIVLDGKMRNRLDPDSKPSQVSLRCMDERPWAVAEYDFDTGDFLLIRDIQPVLPFGEAVDPEASQYPEGKEREAYRRHRHRERRARNAKIRDFMQANGGRLFCEVPRCGFDFANRYGPIGEGYAHVHHLKPLGYAPAEGTITTLSDLAVVCPNCHAMIHHGGENRSLSSLIGS